MDKFGLILKWVGFERLFNYSSFEECDILNIMDNQNQQKITPIQPFPQTPNYFPPSTKNNSWVVSLFVSTLILFTVGLLPLWQLITYKGNIGEGGIGLWIESMFLAPVVIILGIICSILVHKYILKTKFIIVYSVIFSIIAGAITTLSIMPGLSLYAIVSMKVTQSRINPNIRIESQFLKNNNEFGYDIIINNNTKNTYSLTGSDSNTGPDNSGERIGIISMSDDSNTGKFNNQLLQPGENRYKITNNLILDPSNYRYENIINKLSKPIKIMIILRVGDMSTGNNEVFYNTYLFNVEPTIAREIKFLYR